MARMIGGLGTTLAAAGALALVALSVSRLTAGEPAPAPAVPKPAIIQAARHPAPPPAPRPEPEPEGLVVKRVLPIDGPLKYGKYHWDDAGVPAGPIVITVDLEAETISVFRDGYEIGAAAILYGADDKPTPLGWHTITQKDADHVSNLYGAPMPYMMRLTNDGVAIHGTAKVAYGYATHGCIGVPTPFARLIFNQVRIGSRVIITNGKRLNVGGLIAPTA